jgi:hypothetical protein
MNTAINLCSKASKRLAALIGAWAVCAACFATTADLPIYSDSLAPAWVDWSWNVTRNLANPSPVHSGAKSIAVTVSSPWGALYLHADAPVSTANYERIQFWVHGGATGGQQMQLVVSGSNYAFAPAANAWTLVSVPLSALGYPATLTDIYWQDASGSAKPTFYIDDITLMAGSGGDPAPVAGPALTIDVNADRHLISSDIYGINLLGDEALATELRLPVRRWGGNSTSRYNWQNDTTNTGMDWYFENIPNDNPNPASLPDGSAADRVVEQNLRTGTRTLMTLPTIGWVAKRRTSGHPFDCAYKVSKYGAQQSTDPWDSNCGNGVTASGVNITGNDPADTSVASNPAFITGWINHLVGKYANAANGGVSYYAFDNEPMIWHGTHRDVHPRAPTYDEIRDRTFLYGAAIKAADPTAKTLGPVEDGWCRYLYSAADNCSPGADYLEHGSVQYVPWYLQQMKGYEQQHGVRILDYLDLHYYPSANGVALSPAGQSATQALRLRSTRSLWDATYIDESWISDTQNGGVAVRMIPRMKQWAAENYPGTKSAITEYNWGAPESMNGALAQADVLGIFGREGLDLATLWGDVLATQPLSFAFRMYRNYDGHGHGFGDTAVRSLSADQSALAVYAAQRSADGALTIMVVNKSGNALTSTIGLAGFNAQPNAAVYRYSPANMTAIERVADQAITASGFTATVPASSITLFVMTNASAFSLIDHYYSNILNRAPDAGGKTFWQDEVARMSGLGVSATEAYIAMASKFYTSPEFLARNLPDEQYLQNLYLTFLNRPAEQTGLDSWKSLIAAGLPRDMVMYGFMFSNEFNNFMVQNVGSTSQRPEVGAVFDYYRGILGRLPEDAGIKYWVNQFRSAQCSGNPSANVYAAATSIAAAFFGSPEYINGSPTPRDYVADLYNAFMRRIAEPGGYNYWVDQITRGLQTKDQARLAFIESPEFAGRVLAITGESCTGLMQ